MSETMQNESGLVHAYLLDGAGGGRRLELADFESWTPGQGEYYDWAMWLRAAGAARVDPASGEGFSHTGLAMQAAVEGQGVALGSDSVAGDLLAAHVPQGPAGERGCHPAVVR